MTDSGELAARQNALFVEKRVVNEVKSLLVDDVLKRPNPSKMRQPSNCTGETNPQN
jgi:hypothetical protein